LTAGVVVAVSCAETVAMIASITGVTSVTAAVLRFMRDHSFHFRIINIGYVVASASVAVLRQLFLLLGQQL
jgi:hypothetical protein